MDAEDRLQALVRRCQYGERAAFEELFKQFQPKLKYYVRRLDGVTDHTDDVLQDIWIKVIRGIRSLKDEQAFIAWLYTIVRNEVYSRARMKDPFIELTSEPPEPATGNNEPSFTDEDAARIHQALGSLKARHREVLTLSFLEDLPHKQIAEILGIRDGTVKSRIYHAKQALRKELERNHE